MSIKMTFGSKKTKKTKKTSPRTVVDLTLDDDEDTGPAPKRANPAPAVINLVDDDDRPQTKEDDFLQAFRARPNHYLPSIQFNKRSGLVFKPAEVDAGQHFVNILKQRGLSYNVSSLKQTSRAWLTDTCLDDFGRRLEDIYPNAKFLASSFLLLSSMKEKISKQKFVDGQRDILADKNFLFSEYCEGGHHYVFLIDAKDKSSIAIYGADSLNALTDESPHYKALSKYFGALYPDADINWETFDLPNQDNQYDCGVSVCALMELHAQGKVDDDMIERLSKQANFNYGPYRQRIAGVLSLDDADVPKLKLRC